MDSGGYELWKGKVSVREMGIQKVQDTCTETHANIHTQNAKHNHLKKLYYLPVNRIEVGSSGVKEHSPHCKFIPSLPSRPPLSSSSSSLLSSLVLFSYSSLRSFPLLFFPVFRLFLSFISLSLYSTQFSSCIASLNLLKNSTFPLAPLFLSFIFANFLHCHSFLHLIFILPCFLVTS